MAHHGAVGQARKARMNNTMTIYCRLIDGMRMLKNMSSSLHLFDSIANGIQATGINDEAFQLSEEIAKRANRVLSIYASSLINMIYATGMTNERLSQFELYDFLIGYTGEMTNTEGLSAHTELIRKMGSDLRKQHDELMKKEQGK